MAKDGEYPEFIVPAEEVRDENGKVEKTKLDFSKKTFQERVGQIKVKESGTIKETETVSDFYDKLMGVKGQRRKSSQVKYNPKLRGDKGQFVSASDQRLVIQRYEMTTGLKFSNLKGKQQKDVFRAEFREVQNDKLQTDLDRSDVVNNVSQRFDANSNFSLEIKGSDGKSRTYTNKADAIDALNSQLNRFYQSVGKRKKS